MKPAWWLRALARVPFPILYGVAAALAFLVHRVLRYRLGVVRANLRACFPGLDRHTERRLIAAHYRGTLQVLVETLKLAGISAAELRARVGVANFELVQAPIRAGESLILVAAHQCNWEWLLQRLALDLGAPMNSAYKPLHSESADRQMLALRSRFGARLIAAKKLLREIVRMRHQVQAVCFLADQVPSSSVSRHWLTFLGRETAFYPGPAEIAVRTGYAAYFVRMRRLRTGYYEVLFEPLTRSGEKLEPIAFTRLYAARIEAQIRDFPADWMWTHRRWKLKRKSHEYDASVSG